MRSHRSKRGSNAIHSDEETNVVDDSNLTEVRGLRSIDIMVERGRRAMLWPGNVRYVELIQEFVPQYQLTKSHSSKALVVSQVLSRIAENGARFVRRSDNCDDDDESYEQVPDIIAKKKVGQTLRHYLRQHSKAQSRNKERSSKTRTAKIKKDNKKSMKKFAKKKALGEAPIVTSTASRCPSACTTYGGVLQPTVLKKKDPQQGTGERHSQIRVDHREKMLIANFADPSEQGGAIADRNMPPTTLGTFKLPGKPNTSLFRLVSHEDDGAKMMFTRTSLDLMDERAESPSSFLDFREGAAAFHKEEEVKDTSPALAAISRSIFEEVDPIDPVYPGAIPVDVLLSGQRVKTDESVESTSMMSFLAPAAGEEEPPCLVVSRDHDKGDVLRTKSSTYANSEESFLYSSFLFEQACLAPLPEVMQATDDEESFKEDEFLQKIESTIGWP